MLTAYLYLHLPPQGRVYRVGVARYRVIDEELLCSG